MIKTLLSKDEDLFQNVIRNFYIYFTDGKI